MMCLSALLFAGCGQAHKNHTMIETFMESEMGLKDYDVVTWSEPKSTFFVSDSMLQVIRKKAEREALVKRGVNYTASTEKLNFIQVKYVLGRDTLRSTFYLDDKLTGVVAVKAD